MPRGGSGARVQRRLALAAQLQQKYAPQIAGLFGGQTQLATGFSVGHLTGGSAAESQYQGGVTFDADWLRNTSRKDFKGALVHELTHVYGAGYGQDKRAEHLADAARAVLGPNDPNWTPDAAAARAAERLDMGYQAPGPKAGQHPGLRRLRNTGANAQSKVAAGVLSPTAAAGFSQQAVGLQQTYINALAAIKAQAAAAKGTAKSTFADIKAQRIAGTVGAEADAIGRGIVGSSSDAGARSAVVAEAGTARADAIAARNQALAQLKVSGMQAGTDLQLGLGQLATDKAAAQAELAAQRYQNDLFDTQQSNYQKLYKSILARLLAQRGNPGGGGPTVPTGLPADLTYFNPAVPQQR